MPAKQANPARRPESIGYILPPDYAYNFTGGPLWINVEVIFPVLQKNDTLLQRSCMLIVTSVFNMYFPLTRPVCSLICPVSNILFPQQLGCAECCSFAATGHPDCLPLVTRDWISEGYSN